jgi:hypothetical protein
MRNQDAICRRVALVGLAGALLATLGCGSEGPAAQEGGTGATPASQVRRVIRPEKSPDIGLPYSSGILAGNTLYTRIELQMIAVKR